jgi:hypothetical protein
MDCTSPFTIIFWADLKTEKAFDKRALIIADVLACKNHVSIVATSACARLEARIVATIVPSPFYAFSDLQRRQQNDHAHQNHSRRHRSLA